VLSVTGLDAGRGIIRCRRDTYQRLVVQPQVATGVEQLSVTGVLTGRDATGRACVLLGKRSAETRMYAGMWELGPAGGISPPPDDHAELDHQAITAELLREVQEEIGLQVASAHAQPMGIVYDPHAHSYDISMRIDLGEASDLRPHGWEYAGVRWLPIDEIPFLLESGERLIPPTRLLLSRL
jgi:8-oxo-dGTP pyrophosphatase MutT (NUDIX family)